MPIRLAIASIIALLGASLPARASLLIDASLGMLPFGPFTPSETVVVTASIVNVSNQDVTICEGVCAGATYQLGGFASNPIATGAAYNFNFGDGSDPSAGIFDGKADGTLAPGQSESFVFAEYTPVGGDAPVGTYSFDDQLQIFDGTPDRSMVGSASFGGTWSVVPPAVPEPPSALLLGSGLLLVAFGGSLSALTGAMTRWQYGSKCYSPQH